jgi:ketosteroid isomerase-like protein
MEGKKNQSKCFHDFSKALAQEESKYNKQKDIVAVRGKKTVAKTQKVAKALKTLPSKVVKNPSQGNTAKTKKLAIAEGIPASHIENWARAWEKQDVASYIAFYSKEFKGFKNHRGAWEASRQRALRKNKNISIRLSHVQIHEKGKEKIEVNFIQKYQSDGYTDTGIKELLLEKRKAGWKIVKETWMPAAASTKNKHSASRTEQINAKLASWLKAWEDQDVNAYLSFYSDKFKAPKGSRTKSKWKNSRYRALKANKNISIQVSNLQINSSKKTIELNFIQEFNSDKFSSVGIKELVWEKIGSDWKILKETWISS